MVTPGACARSRHKPDPVTRTFEVKVGWTIRRRRCGLERPLRGAWRGFGARHRYPVDRADGESIASLLSGSSIPANRTVSMRNVDVLRFDQATWSLSRAVLRPVK